MPMNDIRNSPIAERNGSGSKRLPNAYQHSAASAAVTTGTGDRNRMLGQENQRCAIPGIDERRPDAHRDDGDGDADEADAPGAPAPRLQIALGLHDEPARSEQTVAEHQRNAGQHRERRQEIERAAGEVATVDLEALDEGAEHHSLRKRRHRRAEAERHAP